MKKPFSILGLALLATVALTIWLDYNREWKKYQKNFGQMLLAQAPSPQEKETILSQPLEVKAFWLREIDRVDRCISCHLGLEDPRFKSANQPYRTHPEIPKHPFDRFGCTLCHQGQGRATTTEAAHGMVEHWPEPILKPPYIQSSCGRCHDPATLTAAPVLNLGAKLYSQLGCQGCHKIAGRGGDIGPELTKAGNFSIEYLRESIVNPRANDPNSVMPALPLSPDQVEALVVYLLSLKGERPLPGLMPPPVVAAMPAVATPLSTSGETSSREALYADLRCYYCHTLQGKGGKTGPALDGVGKKRGQAWLAKNLKEPSAIKSHAFLAERPLTEEQAATLANYLSELDSGLSSTKATDRGENGKLLYAKYRCDMCHKIAGQGGPVGPELTKIGTSRDQAWLARWIKNPQAVSPKATMPNLGVPDADAQALAGYLASLK